MDQLWQETQALLDSLDQAYNAILAELATTTDQQRARQLRARASACIADYQATVRRYRAAKQTKMVLAPSVGY